MKTAIDLRGRSFLTLADYSAEEMNDLIDLAGELKAAKREGREEQKLAGKSIALIFEKDSTRTRCAFEVAAYDQGAHVTFIGPSGSHMGHKETAKDTARVLGRMYDAIEFRGYAESVADELASWSGVPVYNGLTDEWHPTQILADFLTMREHSPKPLEEITFAYLGDARFNMADTYIVGAAKLGMDVRIASPKALWPRKEIVRTAAPLAKTTGAKITITESLEPALSGADFVITDVWVSMGEADSVWAERIEMLRPYQVNAHVMALTGNSDAKFMHCLPSFHTKDTAVGEEIYEKYGMDALEVTDEVFESPASLLTLVEVDAADPAFGNPTKPIGPVYAEEESEKLAAEKGWSFKLDGDSYRRVVPSPLPQRIFGLDALNALLDHDCIVICAGG